MRRVKMVDSNMERKFIELLGYELLSDGYNASNSVIVTVSSDYSSIVGQLLRHQLSYDGEICDGFSIDVPYPDQSWDDRYVKELYDTFKAYSYLFYNKTPILVEAAVIRGSNYKYVVDFMKRFIGLDTEILTVALFENISAEWQSKYVGQYYDNEFDDLTFWWEKENNHWK